MMREDHHYDDYDRVMAQPAAISGVIGFVFLRLGFQMAFRFWFLGFGCDFFVGFIVA
jgi:hypothetical protein